MPSPVKRSSVPSCSSTSAPIAAWYSPSTRHHVLGIGGLGERGEAAQVEEDDGDLAPVALQRIVGAAGDDQLGELRREEALQPADLLELRERRRRRAARACGSARRARSLLAQQLVVQRLDAQQRAHARQQLGLADRLAEEVVGAGVEALGALLRPGRARSPGRPAASRAPGRRGSRGRRRSRSCPASSRRAGRGRAARRRAPPAPRRRRSRCRCGSPSPRAGRRAA